MTGVLHTARINTIEVIMCSDKLMTMVNFKFGNDLALHVAVDTCRAPVRCLGGHGFDSCQGLRVFLCPSLKFTVFINLSLLLLYSNEEQVHVLVEVPSPRFD